MKTLIVCVVLTFGLVSQAQANGGYGRSYVPQQGLGDPGCASGLCQSPVQAPLYSAGGCGAGLGYAPQPLLAQQSYSYGVNVRNVGVGYNYGIQSAGFRVRQAPVYLQPAVVGFNRGFIRQRGVGVQVNRFGVRVGVGY